MPRVISIDKFRGNSGGHRYQCILTDPKKKTSPGRAAQPQAGTNCAAVSDNLKTAARLRYVVMDLSSLFRETARRCFPKAEIVADSFHVVQQATRAMENVRKRVQKDLAKGRRKYFKRSQEADADASEPT